MAPVKVFGSAVFANAARVMACLEEVGVDYEVIEVNYMAKQHRGPEHVARNVRNPGPNHFSCIVCYAAASSPRPLINLSRFCHRRLVFVETDLPSAHAADVYLQPLGQIPAFRGGEIMLFGMVTVQ